MSVTRFAKSTGAKAALAAVLTSTMALTAIAPAQANDWYYEEDGSRHERVYFDDEFADTRSIYRDDIGRFYIRHGRKVYVQYFDNPRPRRHPPVVTHRRDRDRTAEAAIIAGIVGLGVGAIIAGSERQPERVVTPRRPLRSDAFPDAPTGRPRVVTVDNAYEPWTEGWADWCSNRYRSFNIRTGTYTGYDGVKRFCQVK
jgi:hypothetical protein